MKIYDTEGFPNPIRVRIALKEKQMTDQVEFIPVDVPGGEHKRDAYLKKNPTGTVPALELDDGTIISECTAITEFLDHSSGTPVLTGETAKQRAIIHMMQRRAEVGLLDAVAAYFHHATPGLGPAVEGIQCAQWGEIQLQRARDGMRYFDDVLAKQPYLAGDKFTMADITAFAGLIFAGFAKINIPEDLVNLKTWHRRISQRPSIAGIE